VSAATPDSGRGSAVGSGVVLRMRSRPLWSGLAISGATLLLMLLGAIAFDIWAHARIRDAGWNLEGYRGPRLGRKAPNELRVAAVGGSTTFGFGVYPGDSYPARLEHALRRRMDGTTPVSVANLGFNNDGAVCFESTVEAYEYLKPDVYIIYAGVNDMPKFVLVRQPRDCGRWRSWVFRTFGYLPIGDQLVRDKYFALRYGSVEKGYRLRRFSWDRIGEARQRTATAADGGPPTPGETAQLTEQGGRVYRDLILRLVGSLLARGKGVIVAPEAFSQHHRGPQQAVLHAALVETFGAEPRFRFVDVWPLFPESDRQTVLWDNIHMNPVGNARLADAFVEPVLALAARRSP
jgi:lysophospholipase L1-like esterase